MGLCNSSLSITQSSSHSSPSTPPSILPSTGITWRPVQKLQPANAHSSPVYYGNGPTRDIQNAYKSLINPTTKTSDTRAADGWPIMLHYQASDCPDSALRPRGNGFYSAFEEAWATHGSVLLSPDDVWIAVQLQFCRYMDANGEALRSVFVDHEGQIELEVVLTVVDWPLFMEVLMTKIQEKVKNNVDKNFLPAFSTTTPLQRTLKHLAVMDSMQKYFTYKYTVECGIERVGFMGKLEDWQLLRETISGLAKFHLEKDSKYFTSLREWVADVLVIVDQFIATYTGDKVDVGFWNRVMQERYVRAGSGSARFINGWILTFLTGDYKHEMDVQDIVSQRFNVPVLFNYYGYECKTRVAGGFTGVIHDAATNTYQPQCSVAVIKVMKE